MSSSMRKMLQEHVRNDINTISKDWVCKNCRSCRCSLSSSARFGSAVPPVHGCVICPQQIVEIWIMGSSCAVLLLVFLHYKYTHVVQ